MKNLVPFRRRGLYNIFDDLINEPLLSGNMLDGDAFKLDVLEQDNEYLIEAELPGIDKSEVKVSLDDGTLTISVERSEEKDDSDKNFIHRERRYTSMSRRLHLNNCKADDVSAKLEDGVLRIKIGKEIAEKTTKEITIE